MCVLHHFFLIIFFTYFCLPALWNNVTCSVVSTTCHISMPCLMLWRWCLCVWVCNIRGLWSRTTATKIWYWHMTGYVGILTICMAKLTQIVIYCDVRYGKKWSFALWWYPKACISCYLSIYCASCLCIVNNADQSLWIFLHVIIVNSVLYRMSSRISLSVMRLDLMSVILLWQTLQCKGCAVSHPSLPSRCVWPCCLMLVQACCVDCHNRSTLSARSAVVACRQWVPVTINALAIRDILSASLDTGQSPASVNSFAKTTLYSSRSIKQEQF